ncbi:hypothetical protein BKA57DRAFT_19597 [Linnemannia elongata]|nr:hypothetical protein BKA57DRAFT_19597 [Linnemannia elongata]
MRLSLRKNSRNHQLIPTTNTSPKQQRQPATRPSPLDIPEILERIFFFIIDEQTLLHTVLLVCRQWFHMNQSRILRQVSWDHRVSDDRYLYKIPGAGRLLWQCGWFVDDQVRWNKMIERLKVAHRQYLVRCQEDEKDNTGGLRTAQERLRMYQDKVMWRRTRDPLYFSPLRELGLHGAIQTSTRVAGLLPLVPALTHLRIRTSSAMVLDINSILSHCTLLEVLHVEAVGYNNVIQIPGLWRPITTTADKDASPAHRTPGTLRSFVLGRAIFEQSNLEDMLEHTPHLEVLHLIHLIKGDDQYDEAGLATCDYDWRRLVRLLTTLPLTSTLRSFHFSLLKDTATAAETAEMYAALIDDLPNLIDWTVSGNDLVTSAPLILNRNLHSLPDVISSLKIHWTSSREPYSDFQYGVHPSLQPPRSSIRADKTNWWATIKVVHQYLCRSPNVQEFKLMNGYYLLFHMDIYDRRKYNYSDQSAFRWDKIAEVNIDLVPGNPIWACRNLQSLDLDLRCFKTGEVVYDVQLRVLNGYVARVCPRLRHLSIYIPPPCTEGGIPQRSALQLRLESGLCLLARLECLERLHYNLNTSECDLWDLNWMIPSGQSEKFKAKRWEKMARWCTWREEEKRLETGRDHRLDQRDTGKGLSTVQEQLKNLGLILDVMEMVKEMDREGFRCLPVLSRLCIGSEFEQTPAEEIRRIFAPKWALFR